jgi:hypothetical protein
MTDFRARPTMITPAQAYWNQRHALAKSRDRVEMAAQSINRFSDLSLFQWAQLMAMALEFHPDLILELGRLKGNSTCAFTEAANLLAPHSSRVLSICNSPDWGVETRPRLGRILPATWFEPLTTEKADILTFDFARVLAGANRVLIFWDAHGFEVAECVLGGILPLIATRPHVVIMHDMSDARYAGSDDYQGMGLWNGLSAGKRRMRLGNIDSAVAQAIAILDFTTRNKLTLDSADHSYHSELTNDQCAEMERLLGEMFSLSAHWFWFSLNERSGPYTFPAYARQDQTNKK